MLAAPASVAASAGPAERAGAAERFLALAGDSGACAPERLATLFRILLLGLATETVCDAIDYYRVGGASFVPLFGAALLSSSAFAFWERPALRTPLVAASGVLILRVVWDVGSAANHHYLAALIVSLAAIVRLDEVAPARVLESGIRWILAVVLVAAGVQKVLHGEYFAGEFLASMVSERAGFAAAFQWWIPADELARLRLLEQVAGAGPYRVESVTFSIISNLAYLGELATGLGLLVHRLRSAACLAAIALVVAIESAAHELFFGGLVIALLLSLLRRDVLHRMLPAFVLFYAYLLAMVIGVLPRWGFH